MGSRGPSGPRTNTNDYHALIEAGLRVYAILCPIKSSHGLLRVGLLYFIVCEMFRNILNKNHKLLEEREVTI